MAKADLTAEEWEARTAQRRRENFRVEVGPARFGERGEITLSVSHNGVQWQVLTVTPEELGKVIDALLDWREKRAAGEGRSVEVEVLNDTA